MATQANGERNAHRRKLAAATLLCALGAVSAAGALTILLAPVHSVEAGARARGPCNDQPRWPSVRRPHPADPKLPCAAMRLARTDLESAESEVQAMRRS
jgi:hypothetical protein